VERAARNLRREIFHIKEAMLEPKPVQKPHPPILIGGSGEQLTLRAVARWGDACNVFGDPEMVRKNMPSCESIARRRDAITIRFNERI